MESFNFVADRVIKGRIYPALAQHEARPYTQAWREFGQHWPWTTPLRLQEYCTQHGVNVNIWSVDQTLPKHCYYPICLGFFDFAIDYLSLLPAAVRQRVAAGDLRIVFFYHEGDNPARIKSRLDQLCCNHGMDPACYVFVSSNSRADSLPGFVTFHDFELWYYQRNLETLPTIAHDQPRSHDFTVLNRLHKWWRFVVMADLAQHGILDHSLWSYCESVDNISNMHDCPIEIDAVPQLRWNCSKFLQRIPHHCDEVADHTRNDHSHTVESHHSDSYAYIALESQFDVDQSGGAFITEKTFKPIKHGQLFFVAGGAGSIRALRDLGYDVFDDVLDHSYDLESDHTQRWIQLRNSISKAQAQGLHDIYQHCIERIRHNQVLFCHNKAQRLNTLLRKINDCR